MKTNKDDIRALKSKHRLELVMEETGETFDVDAARSDLWHSKTMPGLTVDLSHQQYEIKSPGTNVEAGDIFTWLKFRYHWNFGKSINYLKNRVPDPKQETQLPRAKSNPQIIREDGDEAQPLDTCQERALQIGGERMRLLFAWSLYDLEMVFDETRIEPSLAPEITVCPRCEKHINWFFKKMKGEQTEYGFRYEHAGALPAVAYSIKRRVKIYDLGLVGSEELEKILAEAKLNNSLREKIVSAIAHSFDDLIDQMGALFLEEEDGLVCKKCAWDELDFQAALELCKKSARRREDAETEGRLGHGEKTFIRDRVAGGEPT